MSDRKFEELNLSDPVMKAIGEMGFEEATPIQFGAIPPIMAGRDVIGQAQTGTGKTSAFGIPIVEKVDSDAGTVQALVLCPTRELAIQTAGELSSLSKHKKGLRILPVYGGQFIEHQFAGLRTHPQVIIGTPGRIMDHLRRKTLDLRNLTLLVLDEADEMLNMGFRDDIDTILKEAPKQRQTVLFSATVPREILDITSVYQRDPVHVKTVHKELTVPSIEQYYLEVRETSKPDTLSRLIDANNIKLSLVFCNTKRRVDELAADLQSRGYLVEALHGDLSQTQRNNVMSKFRKRAIEVLIATDVAARGLDVDDVEVVFNFDLPKDDEYYVHRIGRTGRAGRTGKAYTFVTGRQIYRLKEIERYTRSRITLQKPPTLMDVEESKVGKVLDSLRETISSGQHARYVAHIEKMLEDPGLSGAPETDITTLDIAAALLKMAVAPDGGTVAEEPPAAIRPVGPEGKMVRLFINAGRMEQVQPRDVIDTLSANTSLPSRQIGAISIRDRFTLVDVPPEYVGEILGALKNESINGRRMKIRKADESGPPRRSPIDRPQRRPSRTRGPSRF